MQITLDQDQMKTLVSEALLATIDQQKRDTLIKDAITHLLTPQKSSYSSSPPVSPLQEAFRAAVYACAQTFAREELGKDDNFRARIRALLLDALTQLETKNREATINNLAKAIERGMAYDENR